MQIMAFTRNDTIMQAWIVSFREYRISNAYLIFLPEQVCQCDIFTAFTFWYRSNLHRLHW